jgi:molecular chaperone DnaK
VVRIVICQGESRRLASNLVIGDLVLLNLPRRARGETRIDVEFVLDASGILHVSARDSETGAEQRAKLDLKGGMAPEELNAASKRLKVLANIPVE